MAGLISMTFCVCLSGSLNALDSQLDPVGGTVYIMTTARLYIITCNFQFAYHSQWLLISHKAKQCLFVGCI